MKASVVRVFGLFASVLVAGAAGAQATQALEWKVSSGGNGHWYVAEYYFRQFENAKSHAQAVGGHLATTTSLAELNAIRPLINNSYGADYWLGASRQSNTSPWNWVTNETWSFTKWEPGAPDNGPESLYLEVIGRPDSPGFGMWNDETYYAWGGGNYSLIEFEADCNSDGIVDYGQILSGQLDDYNGDGVPDICQTPVTGVSPVSGPDKGGTLITIKGSNFPVSVTVLVGDRPATNVVRVSDRKIIAQTPPGISGSTSVSVNGWVASSAFYYEQTCTCDLDGDGEVSAGDIAYILLDGFGSCSSKGFSADATEASPFMLQEQPAPEAPRSR